MMPSNLKRYLELEERMLLLDDTDPKAAETIREDMDDLWWRLSLADHEYLNTRPSRGFYSW